MTAPYGTLMYTDEVRKMIAAKEQQIDQMSALLEDYRKDNRDHLTRCVNGRVYPGMGPMDDRCAICKQADALLERAK